MPVGRAVGRVSELGGRGQRPLEGHTDRPANTGDTGGKGPLPTAAAAIVLAVPPMISGPENQKPAIQLKYAAALPREGSVRVASNVAEPSLPRTDPRLGRIRPGPAPGGRHPWEPASREVRWAGTTHGIVLSGSPSLSRRQRELPPC